MLYDHVIFALYSRMNPRKDSREVEVMGAFPGADVVRGKDWSLGDKDGKLTATQWNPPDGDGYSSGAAIKRGSHLMTCSFIHSCTAVINKWQLRLICS